MTQIMEITAAEEQALLEYRELWLAHGRSCEPANRATAEDSIRAMYGAIGEDAPYVWWCDGPAVGSLARTLVSGENLRANLGANLWENLRANLGANLRANLGANLWANVSWAFWGQHECYWPAYFAWPDNALRQMHTDEQRERLGWWLDISRSCGWWQPYRGVVFVCERPRRQDVDETGRMHREGGPAVEWRDGWQVWALWGVRFDDGRWIEPMADSLDAAEVLAIENVEQRMAVIRRMGIERFVERLDHTVLDRSLDGMYELLAIDLNGVDARYLRMRNPSIPGVYHVEGVEGTTVADALAWRAGAILHDGGEWSPSQLT